MNPLSNATTIQGFRYEPNLGTLGNGNFCNYKFIEIFIPSMNLILQANIANNNRRVDAVKSYFHPLSKQGMEKLEQLLSDWHTNNRDRFQLPDEIRIVSLGFNQQLQQCSTNEEFKALENTIEEWNRKQVGNNPPNNDPFLPVESLQKQVEKEAMEEVQVPSDLLEKVNELFKLDGNTSSSINIDHLMNQILTSELFAIYK